MTNRLKIGQVATLLDVSTKTIRHYQQQGLLPDRRDGENGYRYFLPNDLLQLHKIMKLKELGMSLNQIGAVLKQSDQLQTMRAALDTLRAQLEQQKSQIEAQLARIGELLQEENTIGADFDEALPHEAELMAKYREALPDLDPAMLEKAMAMDRKLFAIFKNFNWPGGPDAQFQAAMQQIMSDPAKLKLLEPVFEGFFALMEQQPGAEPDLSALADAIATMAAELDLGDPNQPDNPMETVLFELMAKIMPGSESQTLAQLTSLARELKERRDT